MEYCCAVNTSSWKIYLDFYNMDIFMSQVVHGRMQKKDLKGNFYPTTLFMHKCKIYVLNWKHTSRWILDNGFQLNKVFGFQLNNVFFLFPISFSTLWWRWRKWERGKKRYPLFKWKPLSNSSSWTHTFYAYKELVDQNILLNPSEALFLNALKIEKYSFMISAL